MRFRSRYPCFSKIYPKMSTTYSEIVRIPVFLYIQFLSLLCRYTLFRIPKPIIFHSYFVIIWLKKNRYNLFTTGFRSWRILPRSYWKRNDRLLQPPAAHWLHPFTSNTKGSPHQKRLKKTLNPFPKQQHSPSPPGIS